MEASDTWSYSITFMNVRVVIIFVKVMLLMNFGPYGVVFMIMSVYVLFEIFPSPWTENLFRSYPFIFYYLEPS
jgi:hypothetical protein